MPLRANEYEKLIATPEGRRTIRRAYRDVFGTPNGELVLEDLRYWFANGSTLTPNHINPDPLQTTIKEAKRYVVLYMEGKLEEELDEDGGGTADTDASADD